MRYYTIFYFILLALVMVASTKKIINKKQNLYDHIEKYRGKKDYVDVADIAKEIKWNPLLVKKNITAWLSAGAMVGYLDENRFYYDPDKAKQTQIIHKHISIDINNLISQVKKEGLIINYKCPSCGGKIRVDENIKESELRSCEYCDTTFDILKVNDFIKQFM